MNQLNTPMTSKALSSQYKRGCMPPSAVQELYDLRQKEVTTLAQKPVITVQDVQALERGGKFLIASEHFHKCNKMAREALLQDEHHSVRSAAFLRNRESNI